MRRAVNTLIPLLCFAGMLVSIGNGFAAGPSRITSTRGINAMMHHMTTKKPIYVEHQGPWGASRGTLEIAQTGPKHLDVRFLRLGRRPAVSDSLIMHSVRLTSVKNEIASGQKVTTARGIDQHGNRMRLRWMKNGDIEVRHYGGLGATVRGSKNSAETNRLSHPTDIWVLGPLAN